MAWVQALEICCQGRGLACCMKSHTLPELQHAQHNTTLQAITAENTTGLARFESRFWILTPLLCQFLIFIVVTEGAGSILCDGVYMHPRCGVPQFGFAKVCAD